MVAIKLHNSHYHRDSLKILHSAEVSDVWNSPHPNLFYNLYFINCPFCKSPLFFNEWIDSDNKTRLYTIKKNYRLI